MKVLVTTPNRLTLTAEGRLWTNTEAAHYEFWQRYLDAFDEVLILARVKRVSAPPKGGALVTGPGVEVLPVPHFQGPWAFCRGLPGIAMAVRRALAEAEAVILRVPCIIGELAWRSLPRDKPYAVEVVGDPHDLFSPGSIHHPLRPFFRHWYTRQQSRQCVRACSAAYVTETTLQHRYPPGNTAFRTHYSSIVLRDQDFATERHSSRSSASTLALVGSFETLYKGPDTLIEAVGNCVRRGLDLRLVLVGDGKYRRDLQSRVDALELAGRVIFRGRLGSRQAVRRELDQADLFVMPSRQEGLPRAMIEAMARGLPCLGSTVGGIPELLRPENLFRPDDPEQLAEKIEEVLHNPERLAAMSRRNLARAREYHEDALRARRNAHYRYLKDRTREWIEASRNSACRQISTRAV